MNESMDNSGQIKRQFITFWLDEQEFGADIMSIREIRGWTATTELPHAPHYVLGVINLRGMVLPVIDLKARLGRGRTKATVKNVIIVVRCAEQTMGVLVDAVSDILSVTESDVQVTPELARDADSEFVAGIAVLDQRMVTILSMERLAATLVAQPKIGQAA